MSGFICHVDTLLNYYLEDNYDINKMNPLFHVNIPGLKKAGINLVVFAIFVETNYKPHLSLERTVQHIDTFYSILEKNNTLKLVLNLEDIKKIDSNDKIGVILAIEGAEAVRDTKILRVLYRLGVRMISLTWNQRNQLADGVAENITHGGVTNLGRKVIDEMEKLGIILDVSHLSFSSFNDVLKYSNKPLIASHSNAWDICQHPRNLKDYQLLEIASRNGLVGVNFAPVFLNNSAKAEIIDVIKHIDYIRKLIGINHIILGTDYDGIKSVPAGLENIAKLNKLKEMLYKNGYSRRDINKIFWGNWFNFISDYWG
ncbi:MAG: membrane dipeptidase [Firmicutes bacterium]|nr:membrane dipeptidase [Bacillota bacterium]